METAPEPSEAELTSWVEERLAKMGRAFADRDAVAETLELHRELWVSLYKIEMGHDPDLPDPPGRAEA